MSKEKDKEDLKILSEDELIKALDEKGIEYDRNQITDAYFPLEHVKACLDCEKTPWPGFEMKDMTNHRPCPLCGKPSEELKWIWFESPEWTWQKLCGRAGDMSICPDCRCIVEFICEILS